MIMKKILPLSADGFVIVRDSVTFSSVASSSSSPESSASIGSESLV